MIFNLDIKNLQKDIDKLVYKKDHFILVETGYTARIKQKIRGREIMCLYSEKKEGIPPGILKKYNNFILKYINKTRAIAKDYELDSIKTYNEIGWNSMMANLPRELYLYCIDIRSAYFYSAVNMGLFKKEYVHEFNTSFNKDVGYDALYKNARLVVLGSLATKRRTRVYEYGVCIADSGFVVFDEKMRNVYVEVCRCVDNLMIELCENDGAVGYYWDCVFATSEQSAKIVEDAIVKKGFEYKTEKRRSILYYYPNGGGCIHTNVDLPKKDHKIYQFNYRKVLVK